MVGTIRTGSLAPSCTKATAEFMYRPTHESGLAALHMMPTLLCDLRQGPDLTRSAKRTSAASPPWSPSISSIIFASNSGNSPARTCASVGAAVCCVISSPVHRTTNVQDSVAVRNV